MPLLDIFKTKLVPIIIIKAILLKIAKDILKISPICSNSPVILSSAIGCVMPANNLYAKVSTPNLIIGTRQIPKIMITPTNPTAFFKTTPQPRTVSTASPNILPTTGMAELTTAFVVLAVMPVYTTCHCSL